MTPGLNPGARERRRFESCAIRSQNQPMAMVAGQYLRRVREFDGVGGRAVVLGMRDGGEILDVLTFGGMRSLVPREIVDRLWEPAETLPMSWRSLPLGSGRVPNKIQWLGGSEIRLEVWPWNDLTDTLTKLPRVGLTCGKLIEAKRFGPPGHQAVCQFFAVDGTYREPMAEPDFPPFAEAT